MSIKLRSKVVEIEAVLWGGTTESLIEVLKFTGINNVEYDVFSDQLKVWNHLEDQWINVPLQHYVLCGLKNEFYPCEAEALFMKYEITDD